MRIDVSKVNMRDLKTERLTLMLTEEQRLKIGAMARVRDLTISRFVRHILDQVIKESGDQALEEIENLSSTAFNPPKPGRPPRQKRVYDFD